MRIEEAAAAKQARIESGDEFIIGVNVMRGDHETDLDTLEVDNSEVIREQVGQLDQLKANRDENKVKESLLLLEKACEDSSKNILEAAVNAARVRCTLGEISYTMEKVFHRFKAKNQLISGVYKRNMADQDTFQNAKQLVSEFALLAGRQPRIMVAKLGQDGHDRGAKIIATSFADLGFDVDVGPLFQTPEEAAQTASDNDVHILGISSLAAGHKTLVPETIQALKNLGREDIKVVVGGVIPRKDYDELMDTGVIGIFGPGSPISEAAITLLQYLITNYKSEYDS